MVLFRVLVNKKNWEVASGYRKFILMYLNFDQSLSLVVLSLSFSRWNHGGLEQHIIGLKRVNNCTPTYAQGLISIVNVLSDK